MITPAIPQTREDVAGHYDSLDYFYRDTWGPHVHHGFWESGSESVEEAVENLTRLVAKGAGITRDDRVCDIGCGYGATSWFLAAAYRARVDACTLSAAQCREADSFSPPDPDVPRPVFTRCDWLENDYPADHFDAAVSIECVSHVGDKEKFFREIHRVLKPGARAAVCAWLASANAGPWAARRLLEPICREGRLAGLGTLDDYRALIRASGLELVEARDIGPQVGKTWSVIFRRLVKKVIARKEYRRFLFQNLSSDRVFALTVPRLFLAFRLRCMGYAVLVARKPREASPASSEAGEPW